MRTRYGVILAVIGCIVFPPCGEGWGSDWKEYAKTANAVFYYDTESVTRSSRDVVRVLDKRVYRGKGIIKMMEEIGKNYKTISHELYSLEFHCTEKKVRYLSIDYHTTDGKTLSSHSNPSEWIVIVPETRGESLYKIVCK